MASCRRTKSHEDILTNFSSECLISLASNDSLGKMEKSSGRQTNELKISQFIEIPTIDSKPSSVLFNILEHDSLASSCQSLVHQTTHSNWGKKRSSVFSLFSVYNVSNDRVRRASGVSFLSVRSINMYVRIHRKILLFISLSMAIGIVIFTLLLMFMF